MFQTHQIDLGDITLSVRECGSGPLAIFLHGITANAAVWDPVLDRLSDTFRAVAVDQRGHGRSAKPPSGYHGTDFADDVARLVDVLGGGPALLVGHSLGARNAVFAAAEHPELVSAVVAIDFTPFIEREAFDAVERRIRSGDTTFTSRDAVERYLRDRYPRMPADAIARRATYGFERVDGRYEPLADGAAMIETHRSLVSDDTEGAFSRVRCPLLVIRGEASTVVSASAFEKTRRLRPDARAITIEGADHYVPEEQPAAVTAEITRFVHDVERAPA